jgi:hypothetical protein
VNIVLIVCGVLGWFLVCVLVLWIAVWVWRVWVKSLFNLVCWARSYTLGNRLTKADLENINRTKSIRRFWQRKRCDDTSQEI